jgi:hypothetical protein
VHYLGMLAATLGRFEEAEEHFRAAETVHTRIGAPTWLAQTHLEWARMLLVRHRSVNGERAQELLDLAIAAARELGLGSVERRAIERLSSH